MHGLKEDFLSSYLDAFNRIQGWFCPDAALMFMAYNQLLASENLSGDVLEIGVHHGLSTVSVAALRGEGRKAVAIDLFEDLQQHNVSASGAGSKEHFLRNMRSFFPDLSFLQVIAAPSSSVKPADLGGEFSFCHIDGGHSAAEVYQDLELCYQLLLPGGLVALDDYFNPVFPGVGEGTIKFMMNHWRPFVPIASGFNKVLLQKLPAPFDLKARFAAAFAFVPRKEVVMFDQPVHLFETGFQLCIDVRRSTPYRFLPSAGLTLAAVLEPQAQLLETRPGEPVTLPVRVVNRSTVGFYPGLNLSYHLLAKDGSVVQWDNPRTVFLSHLEPGQERVVTIGIQGPPAPGSYLIEVDMVWEGVGWFKEKGNPTGVVPLQVA